MGCDLWIPWYSGFLDGEGSFLLAERKSGSIKPTIQAQQVVREPIERLAVVLGGTVLERKNRTVTDKPVFQWHVQGGTAARRIIPMLLPYLTVKRAAAQLLLEYAYTIGTRGVRPTDAALVKQDQLLALYRAMPERRR